MYGWVWKPTWQPIWQIAENLKKEDFTDKQIRSFHWNIMNIWKSLTKNELVNSQTNDPGITKLKWNQDLNQNHSKSIIWHRQNKTNLTNFWRKIWKKDTYENSNLLWPHHFSLSKRKMGSFNFARTTNSRMNGQSKMLIHCHLFLK